jgi:hypothetical protein
VRNTINPYTTVRLSDYGLEKIELRPYLGHPDYYTGAGESPAMTPSVSLQIWFYFCCTIETYARGFILPSARFNFFQFCDLIRI